ncbi:hypothetical protein L1887_55219 [Cichorium endivia]|nr:hypothetical protein L1887_55219 [Cichorium endivia]
MAAGGVASTSAPANELLRSVASRLGVWNGAAQVSSSGEQESDTDSHQGAEGTLTPAQQDDISESFKEAQRRIQDDLPAPRLQASGNCCGRAGKARSGCHPGSGGRRVGRSRRLRRRGRAERGSRWQRTSPRAAACHPRHRTEDSPASGRALTLRWPSTPSVHCCNLASRPTSLRATLAVEQPDRVPLTKDLTAQELREASKRHLLFNTHSFFAVGATRGAVFRAASCAADRTKQSRTVEPLRAGQAGRNDGSRGPCVDVEYAKLLKPVPLSKVVRSVLRADPEAENHDIAEDGGSQSFGYGSNNESDAGGCQAQSSGGQENQGLLWFVGVAKRVKLHRLRWERRGQAAAARGKSKASTAGVGADDDQTGDEGAPRSSLDVSETEGDKEARDKVENLRSKIAAKALEEEARKEERERKASQERSKGISDKRRARAEARLRALNPLHRIDYYMPVRRIQPAELDQPVRRAHDRPHELLDQDRLCRLPHHAAPWNDERLERSLDYKDVEGWE